MATYHIGQAVEVRVGSEWRQATIACKVKLQHTDIPAYRVKFPDGTHDMFVFDANMAAPSLFASIVADLKRLIRWR